MITEKDHPEPQVAIPALHAPRSLHTDGLGLWPLPIYCLPSVIIRVHLEDLGDECWHLLFVEVASTPPRRCLARTQTISMGSQAHVGLPPTQSLLPSRPAPRAKAL